MGADLYMEKSYKERKQKHIEELDLLIENNRQDEAMTLFDYLHNEEVYFRDSYNSRSVMWAMGMSWWDDVLPMLDKDGNLSHEDTIKLINMITDAPLNVSTDFLDNMPDEWTIDDAQKYLKEKRINLMYFLNQSLLREERIVCSL